jgi:hypothetical protein
MVWKCDSDAEELEADFWDDSEDMRGVASVTQKTDQL